jgi:antitoxin component of MazEF toxin-antitoxin module
MELFLMKKVNVRGKGRLRQATTRKVRNFGGSYYVCLPVAFCRENKIQTGTELALIVGESLRITPVNKGE